MALLRVRSIIMDYLNTHGTAEFYYMPGEKPCKPLSYDDRRQGCETTTNAETILKMIETVDQADTAKLDEIDAPVTR